MRLVDVATHRTVVDRTLSPERRDGWSVDEAMLFRGWRLVEEARQAGYYDDDGDETFGWRDGQSLEDLMRMAA
jgi:hypothetical protein